MSNKMTDIYVSIIIPVYNVEKYLRQCLDSVVNQTFEDIEIICINDCSADNSLQIIKEYRQKDKRIVLIDLKRNMGQGEARNEAIKIAKGKYITFIDSDDWVGKDYVKVLYDEIEKSGFDVVSSCFYMFDNMTQEQKPYKFSKICYENSFNSIGQKQKLLTNKFIWSAWAKIYKRKFITDNNICFRMDKMEDNLFIFETIVACNNIKFIEHYSYFYRMNRINSTMSNKTTRFYSCVELLKRLKNFLVSENIYTVYENAFYAQVYLVLATEIETTKLPVKQIRNILSNLKNDLNLDLSFNVYIFDRFAYKFRVFIFKYCFKYGIDYKYIGRTIRKLYFCLSSLRKLPF